MLHAGLTGSIAVGKSFVLSVFADLGCATADADEIARRIVEPNTTGLHLLIENFGDAILNADGSLNRARLGAIVFADEAKRKLLNALLHPLIIAEQQRLQKAWEAVNPHGVSVIEAALIIEAGLNEATSDKLNKSANRFAKLIVVHCQTQVQLNRLMKRNKLSEAEAVRRINAQMPQTEKMRYADFLIDSSEGFEATRIQTEKVFQQLSKLRTNAFNSKHKG